MAFLIGASQAASDAAATLNPISLRKSRLELPTFFLLQYSLFKW
jgi:hypothetical protein